MVTDGAAGASLSEVAHTAARSAEKGHIERALREAGGDRARAAALLQVTPRTLKGKIRELGIDVSGE